MQRSGYAVVHLELGFLVGKAGLRKKKKLGSKQPHSRGSSGPDMRQFVRKFHIGRQGHLVPIHHLGRNITQVIQFLLNFFPRRADSTVCLKILGRRPDDDHAASSINNQRFIRRDPDGGVVQTEHGWHLKGPGQNCRMGGTASVIQHQRQNLFFIQHRDITTQGSSRCPRVSGDFPVRFRAIRRVTSRISTARSLKYSSFNFSRVDEYCLETSCKM